MQRMDNVKTTLCLGAAAAMVLLTMHTAAAQTGTDETRDRRSVASGNRGEFINTMAHVNLAEVQLGKMAIEKASTPDVKNYAQMMIKDHSQANTELTAIASQLGIQPPADLDKPHRDLMARLNAVQPRDFDREYVTAMIDGHREAERLLQAMLGRQRPTADPSGNDRAASAAAAAATQAPVGTAGADSSDPLAAWASKTLPVVQQHLEQALQLRQNIK